MSDNIEKINDIDEKINKQEKSITDKINVFFEKIDFLELSWENKAKVAIKVKNDSVPDKLYWIEIFLSWVIAALWLLQNSVAVVIWAMLIAPLLRPINGISYAISMWERRFFWLTAKVLIFSVIFSIITWYLAVKLSWLNIETPEILARTSPNIIDLFIAIFSAMIAVLSLRFDRLSESIAWVAIAAALMPPLAVIGIELALLNYNLAFWAFMLFIANLISIILVAIVFFWMYWFNPNNDQKQKSVMTKTIFVIITIIIISVPLIHSLINIKQKVEISKKTRIYLESVLEQKSKNTKVKELIVDRLNDKTIKISSIISIPEWLDFYDNFKRQLEYELTKNLWKNVELNIELIRTANILSNNKIDKQKQIIDNLETKLSNNLENKINEKLDEKTIQQREYLKKEILNEIKRILKEENLKVVRDKKIIEKNKVNN